MTARWIRKVKSFIKDTKLFKFYRHKQEVIKLKNMNKSCLNFGCGPNVLDGFINIDGGDGENYTAPSAQGVVSLDAFDALAVINNNTVDFVASEHFFEHFTRQDGHFLLREWYRVLKPGGVLRIVMPDLENEVAIYLGCNSVCDFDRDIRPHREKNLKATTQEYGKLLKGENFTRAMNLNNGMHMDGHKFLYDYETISQSLRIAGFLKITRCRFGESLHPQLSNIDKHDGGETGRHWVPNIALVVEAQKPVSS